MEDVGIDYLAKVKRNIGVFRSGGVYWCGSKHIGFDTDYRRRNGIRLDCGKSPTADTFPSAIIPNFKNQDRLLIVRGGIGDLLALSILQREAKEVHVVTSKGLFPVLDWWQIQPKRKHFNEPLTTIKYPTKIEEWAKRYGQQNGDEVIAQGSPENWYRIISKSVGKEFIGGRPQLNVNKIPDAPNRLDHPSILIVHQATSRNRSASLSQIVRAIKTSRLKDIYFYDIQRRLNGEGEKTTIKQYLADLYYADFVISVDTSAIHFREGICKPALGLYSSFSAESRTKYYEFTQSMDIASPCLIRPCFKNMTDCPYAEKDYIYPPCLGEHNNQMVEQISNKLKEMIL